MQENVENMTAIGKIESFDETQEKWETYAERVEQFFLTKKTSMRTAKCQP